MGNKQYKPVILPQHVKTALSTTCIETLHGHFSLAGGVATHSTTNSKSTSTLQLSKQNFKISMASYLNVTHWPNVMLERLFLVSNFSSKDGTYLIFDDYITLLYIISLSGTKEMKIALLFRIYDIDASGYITKKNLSKMLAIHTGMDQVKDSWKVTVSRYDHHSNTVVDASEKLKQTDLNSVSDVMVETAMAFYDTDKDGKLNMNEFRHFAEDSYEIAMMLESWKEPERIDAPWKCVELKEAEEVEFGI